MAAMPVMSMVLPLSVPVCEAGVPVRSMTRVSTPAVVLPPPLMFSTVWVFCTITVSLPVPMLIEAEPGAVRLAMVTVSPTLPPVREKGRLTPSMVSELAKLPSCTATVELMLT